MYYCTKLQLPAEAPRDRDRNRAIVHLDIDAEERARLYRRRMDMHQGFKGAVVSAAVQAYAFPGRCHAIRAEHPDLPKDSAVVRFEHEMRAVFTLCPPFWQGGGG